MSIFMRIVMWVGQLAGIGALILGLLHWLFQVSFIEFHMLFGITVTLALLTIGLVAIFTSRLRILGAIAIVFTPIIPLFGMNQMFILIGNFHWIIQIAHLLVGATAVILIEQIGKQYAQIKQKKPVASQKVAQAS